MPVFLRRINTSQSNLVLHLVGIQHGDGVAVSNAHNSARDRLGMGGAGQRQQQAYKGFSHGGLRLAADNNIKPWQRTNNFHRLQADGNDTLK